MSCQTHSVEGGKKSARRNQAKGATIELSGDKPLEILIILSSYYQIEGAEHDG